jgi:hypothetical protein
MISNTQIIRVKKEYSHEFPNGCSKVEIIKGPINITKAIEGAEPLIIVKVKVLDGEEKGVHIITEAEFLEHIPKIKLQGSYYCCWKVFKPHLAKQSVCAYKWRNV